MPDSVEAPPSQEQQLLRMMSERGRKDCWLDWPFSTAYGDSPQMSLQTHPVTGKRWSGRVVRVLWWWETGVWPGPLRMTCRWDCWNPWHAIDRRGHGLPVAGEA